MTFLLEPTDNFSAKLRVNDRLSDRAIGAFGYISEGPEGMRGAMATTYAAYGLRSVPEGTPGALSYSDPGSGALIYGLPVRPGIDEASALSPMLPLDAQISFHLIRHARNKTPAITRLIDLLATVSGLIQTRM